MAPCQAGALDAAAKALGVNAGALLGALLAGQANPQRDPGWKVEIYLSWKGLLGAKVDGCIISYLRMKLGNLWKSGNFPGFSYLWIAANGHLEGWKTIANLGLAPATDGWFQFHSSKSSGMGRSKTWNQHFSRPKYPLKRGESVEHGRNTSVFWIQHKLSRQMLGAER